MKHSRADVQLVKPDLGLDIRFEAQNLAVHRELGTHSLFQHFFVPHWHQENDLAWIGLVVRHDEGQSDLRSSIFDGLMLLESNGISSSGHPTCLLMTMELLSGDPRDRLQTGAWPEAIARPTWSTVSRSAFDQCFEMRQSARQRHRDRVEHCGPHGALEVGRTIRER